jgi:hypothetical protein
MPAFDDRLADDGERGVQVVEHLIVREAQGSDTVRTEDAVTLEIGGWDVDRAVDFDRQADAGRVKVEDVAEGWDLRKEANTPTGEVEGFPQAGLCWRRPSAHLVGEAEFAWCHVPRASGDTSGHLSLI